jgi:hypothetical protein
VLPIIREIQRAGHSSYNAIATQLNARKVATARGGRWTQMQVGHILRPGGSLSRAGVTPDHLKTVRNRYRRRQSIGTVLKSVTPIWRANRNRATSATPISSNNSQASNIRARAGRCGQVRFTPKATKLPRAAK